MPATRLLLALDHVADPGNLGTLWRLADWYGLPGLVLCENCADPFTPKAIAASMGAFGRVPVWADVDLPAWLQALPAGVGVFGADLEGDNVHQAALATGRRAGHGQRKPRPRPRRGRAAHSAACTSRTAQG
ncbi:MAG: TrmH family RNA methyltransferase [Hymenobacter sp.]